MTEFDDFQIQNTIDSYARTVGTVAASVGSHSHLDDALSVSMRSTVPSQSTSSRSSNIRDRGSKAVLSALRALQNKIAAINREHAECQQKHEERVQSLSATTKKLKLENSRMRSQIKQFVKLNQSLTAKLKESAITEQRATRRAQDAEQSAVRNDSAAHSELLSLRKEVDRLQRESVDRHELENAVKLYAERLETAKTNLSILKDEVRRQRARCESVTAQKQKSDDFVAELMAENERMHSKALSLQKSKMRSTRNRKESASKSIDIEIAISPKIKRRPRTKTNSKMNRSKSVHSMKRSIGSKHKKRPFVPSGNPNASFSSIDRRESSKLTSRRRSKMRARSRTTTKIKSLPISSLRVNDRKQHKDRFDRLRLAELVHVDAADAVFDGIDIDDVLQ